MSSNHGKKLIPLLLLVMIVLVSPVAAEENRSDLPTVKIVYWRSIDDLPLYVGVEKGFFKEAGVNVALKFIKGEPNVLAAVLRGDVNGGYISLASLIKLAEKKVPVKVVMWMAMPTRAPNAASMWAPSRSIEPCRTSKASVWQQAEALIPKPC